MTERSQSILKWSVPILATLTALIGVEELRQLRGIPELLGLILAVGTAVVGYVVAVQKPEQPNGTVKIYPPDTKAPPPQPAQPAPKK